MSQAAPGYVASRQVPPTRSARSRMTTSSTPASRSLIAVPSPVNPAPITTTSWRSWVGVMRPSASGFLPVVELTGSKVSSLNHVGIGRSSGRGYFSLSHTIELATRW